MPKRKEKFRFRAKPPLNGGTTLYAVDGFISLPIRSCPLGWLPDRRLSSVAPWPVAELYRRSCACAASPGNSRNQPMAGHDFKWRLTNILPRRDGRRERWPGNRVVRDSPGGIQMRWWSIELVSGGRFFRVDGRRVVAQGTAQSRDEPKSK